MPKKSAEKEVFSSDDAKTPEDRNEALAVLLCAAWNPLNLVKIERVEKETTQGWRATYRE